MPAIGETPTSPAPEVKLAGAVKAPAPKPAALPRPVGGAASRVAVAKQAPVISTAHAQQHAVAVHQAIGKIFAAQAPQHQAAIVKGVLSGRADPETVAAVRDAVAQMGNRQVQFMQYLPARMQGPNLGSLLEKTLSSVAQAAGRGAGIGVKTRAATPAELKAYGGTIPGIGTVTPFGNPTTLGKNTLNDAWNLPSSTVEGLYNVGNDIVHGHEGNAFHALVDPYIQLMSHPAQTIEQHPLNSVLMFLGPKDLAARAAGGAARAGMLGDAAQAAASTARDSLHLGTVAGEPSPITEARSYSPDVVTKAMQAARERYMVRQGRNPNVSAPASRFVPQVMRQAFNIGTEAKLNRIADEMTAVRQMAGREERAQALDAVRKAAPPKEVSGVVSHILQGVVRKPETAITDITNEINRLKAAQTGKRTAEEIWNRKQVRDLSTALQHPDKLPAAFGAAKQIRQSIKTQDAYLVAHGLLDPEQAARRAVLPYAMTHMGAVHDPVSEVFTHPNGDPLSTDQIFEHIKASGTPDPAYVGHFPGKVSPARFYSSYKLARGSLGNKGFTGAAFKAGHYDHTFDGLAGQVASRAEAVTKASLHDRVINRMGIKMPKQLQAQTVHQVLDDVKAGKRTPASAKQEIALIRQGLFTKDEANRFARAAKVDDHGNPIPNALELTPISTAPAHVLGQVKDLQHPQELGNLGGLETGALAHAIEDAQHSTARNVTLIPSVAAQRFADQFAKTDSTLRGIGKITQQFRRTVLPYSTHWMTQIGSEAGLRGMLAGVLDPRYLRDGRELMKRLETTEDGRAALMEMVNATFYGMSAATGGGLKGLAKDLVKGGDNRGAMDVYNPHPGIVSSAAHAFPPTRVLLAAHNRYANLIGHAMYTLEHQARVMGLGKLAHQQATEFGHSWSNAVRLQAQTLDQLATHLKSDPALVAKFGRQIDETFGKYNKFSPKVRAAVQSYAPFLPWYLNAAKYVLWNLPAHHPVASALLASLRQTINQDVQDGKQAPLNTYAMQELARISPFGIFTPDSPTPSVANFVKGQALVPGGILPEAQGSLYNYAGDNSFGQGPLKGPHGDVKAQTSTALAAAMSNLLESFLPGVRYVRLAEEGGHPAYGTSTVLSPQPKPGPGSGVINRIFNPFYSFEEEKNSSTAPAYGAEPSTGSSSSGSWGSSGGWGTSSSSGWGSGGWGTGSWGG